jgi:hypothetical protein
MSILHHDPDDSLVAEVSDLLRAEHRMLCEKAHPPAAGVVWWRAERRRRDEAARMAARPITVVHAVASACGAGVAAALLQVLTPWLRQWISAAGGLARLLEWDTTSFPAGYITMLALVALASLVAPLALYVALSDDK